MSNPNIVNVTTIYGNTQMILGTTVLSNVMVNSAASNAIIKVNDIVVTNYSNAAVTSNVAIQRSTVNYFLAGNISVPAYSTLVVTGKDTAFYMLEGDQLMANVSANTAAHVIASFETIS